MIPVKLSNIQKIDVSSKYETLNLFTQVQRTEYYEYQSVRGTKPCGLKFILVWEPYNLKHFVPLKDYQTPDKSNYLVFVRLFVNTGNI